MYLQILNISLFHNHVYALFEQLIEKKLQKSMI